LLQFPQQFPPNNPQNSFNTPFNDNFNNNNGLINQNPYDVEYERKIRIETEKLRQLLIEIDTKNSAECSLNVAAQWTFETNVNEVSQLEAVRKNDFFVSQHTYDIDLNMLLTLLHVVPIRSSKSHVNAM
jgi:hypothetical protein